LAETDLGAVGTRGTSLFWGLILWIPCHHSLPMAWNVFKLCTGLKVVGSVMILVVLSVVGVSYYAVVVANYVPQVWKGASATATALLVLVLFHFLVRVFSLCPSLCLILFFSSSDFLISLLFS
jgi:hypothetical protein